MNKHAYGLKVIFIEKKETETDLDWSYFDSTVEAPWRYQNQIKKQL